MITTLLVANRAEIARRVIATCRLLGIATVAVHSDADAAAPHVREADAAVRLPGSAASDTYLRGDLLIEAALRAGADAVHPGYGFLSENAAFAAAVQAAGLIWVGPPPHVIAAMGSKIDAKKIMAAAGVPVLADLDPSTVTAADLPVLVKASAGGGGRGMRVVRALPDLPGAVAGAGIEAASAFGDGAVFVEPYVERSRHIEVQVLADAHGTVWALGERECSIQRRHQKVLEESPSPFVDATPGLREQLCEAAVAAARAIGYVGAGTLEFLVDGNCARFFFLEANTRLQVEHPVTEARYGLDLVQLQLAVADGARLEVEPPAPRGHAIEVRLYAEDPGAGWAPQTGVVHEFTIDDADTCFTAGPRDGSLPHLRVDSAVDGAVDSGNVVSPFYDAMLAKVIAWAPTRAGAAARLASSLARARLHGPRTNRDLLVRILRDDAFAAGQTHTAFLDDLHAGPDSDLAGGLGAALAGTDAVRLSALAAALACAEGNRANARVQAHLPTGWRNLAATLHRKSFQHSGSTHDIDYCTGRAGLVAPGFDAVQLIRAEPGLVVLEVDGVRRRFDIARYGSEVYVDSALGPVRLEQADRFPRPEQGTAAGSLLAPMPGTVVRLGAQVGDQVAAGQPVVWLEAMKMEHVLVAPAAGVLSALPQQVGQQVEQGVVLAVVTPQDQQVAQQDQQVAQQVAQDLG